MDHFPKTWEFIFWAAHGEACNNLLMPIWMWSLSESRQLDPSRRTIWVGNRGVIFSGRINCKFWEFFRDRAFVETFETRRERIYRCETWISEGMYFRRLKRVGNLWTVGTVATTLMISLVCKSRWLFWSELAWCSDLSLPDSSKWKSYYLDVTFPEERCKKLLFPFGNCWFLLLYMEHTWNESTHYIW